MKAGELYDAMALPDSCHLGKRVFKRLFQENATLTAADKRALSADVDTILWQYTLKSSTLPVQPHTDDDREYHEVPVLEVAMRNRRNAGRIAEVVHRAIPYPVFVVLSHDDAVAVSVAHKRFSRAERGAIVAEGILTTPWIEGDERSPAEASYLASLALRTLPQTHFLALYGALVARALALVCAGFSGRFELSDSDSDAERRERLEQCRRLERGIGELRAAIRSEASFARQVELNARIKGLEKELTEVARKL